MTAIKKTNNQLRESVISQLATELSTDLKDSKDGGLSESKFQSKYKKTKTVMKENILSVCKSIKEDGGTCAGAIAAGPATPLFTKPIKRSKSKAKLEEKAPPGMEAEVLKLKKQYPNDHAKAFATAWTIHNKKKAK